ncbi:MAG: hypothetical protein JWM80_3785 [Cyanobacteria bacterium RYN_339]|nr:hypothetical protein [Cyanobacteria bacterium RYN_339]
MNRQHQLRCVRSNVALSAEVAGNATRRAEHTGLVNLSGTGCLLEDRNTLAVGDVVFMRFSLPGQSSVETTGRVARRIDNQVGVQFDEMTEATSEKIVRHVVSRRK